MNHLQFTKFINAPRSLVWELLWSDEGYRYWTSAFCEGSYAESDWQEGSSIRFLTPSGEGMYSRIKTKRKEEQMIFEHLGEIKDGKEVSKDWAGANEGYSLQDQDGGTLLTVDLDIDGNFESYFKDTFPKALERLRNLAEKKIVM